MNRFTTLAAAGLLLGLGSCASAPSNPMTFFMTSETPTGTGNLGGLAGADAICQNLAAANGAGGHTWRAYLSTQGTGAVNARDRIGAGPWRNAQGTVVATNVAQLHGANNLTLATVLDEKGRPVNGRRSTPNKHDVLTGSRPDGTAFPAGEDRSCRNWTSDAADAIGMLGHHDREGLRDDDASRSWNSSHPSRGGCGAAALRSTGGAGLLYCFATN